MTALLDAPEVILIEARQPEVPIICTRGHSARDQISDTPCPRTARWEALCMSCGHVFRRCEEHHAEDAEAAETADEIKFWEPDVEAGQCHLCATCDSPVFIQQYVRIGA